MTEQLIQALQNPARYPHPVAEVELIETHISWVLLTGEFAYKIKKPVNLGFLDFSTLERRAFYCREELRLNRRLAPELYLTVVSITGTERQPLLCGSGEAIEYAVKMRQFDQAAQLDRVLARNELLPAHIDLLAAIVSHFHQNLPSAPVESPFGTAAAVRQPVLENFIQIRAHLQKTALLQRLAPLEAWSHQQCEQLKDTFAARKADGFIRECHGDMHLRNMALIDNKVVVFDCIEFNENLRWIDVISEIAFLVMDLQDRQQPQLAQRFLNAYLEKTGDYAGLRVLRFYQLYRAMVRTKVDAIRLHQAGMSGEESQSILNDLSAYLHLAGTYTGTASPCLIITHGVSGTGKTTHTQPLVEQLPAIRIRSDVERKRLFGIAADTHRAAEIDQGIYTPEATARTYERLKELSALILRCGYTVIVDATFLQASCRQPFILLARELGLPFYILDFSAPPELLRQRIRQRQLQQDASDATLAVLEKQLARYQPLSKAEQQYTLSIDTADEVDMSEILQRLRQGSA